MPDFIGYDKNEANDDNVTIFYLAYYSHFYFILFCLCICNCVFLCVFVFAFVWVYDEHVMIFCKRVWL